MRLLKVEAITFREIVRLLWEVTRPLVIFSASWEFVTSLKRFISAHRKFEVPFGNLRVLPGRPIGTFALFEPTSGKVVSASWKFEGTHGKPEGAYWKTDR
jgi:hypothetical protein